MTEEEILIRAREASIAAGYTRGIGISAFTSAGDETAIRRGLRDSNWSILCAAQALRDLTKPLSEIQPDPDLIEARQLVAERYSCEHGRPHVLATLRGEDDDSQAIENCMRAIKRGRELERATIPPTGDGQ